MDQELKIKIDTTEIMNEIHSLQKQVAELTALILPKVDEFKTIDEILDSIKVSRSTFFRLMRKYDIPKYQVGKRILFKLPEVMKALQVKRYIK